MQEDHLKTLDALGVLDTLHAQGLVFPGTPEAIGAARRHLKGVLEDTGKGGGDPPPAWLPPPPRT